MEVRVYNFTRLELTSEVELVYRCECPPDGEPLVELKKITIRIFEGEKQ